MNGDGRPRRLSDEAPSFPSKHFVDSSLLILAALFLNGCGNVNNVSGPPAPATPGPLTILTSSPLPAGTTSMLYDITLAPSGGTPPYAWSLAPGSPTLPNGLVLNASTGKYFRDTNRHWDHTHRVQVTGFDGNFGPKSPFDHGQYRTNPVGYSDKLTHARDDQPILRICLKSYWWYVTLYVGSQGRLAAPAKRPHAQQ